jgi:membrane protein
VLADRVTLIAAGATYLLCSLYFLGWAYLFRSTVSCPTHLTLAFLPPGAFDLLLPQLEALSSKGRSQLSFAFALSLLLAFWSATSGIKALFDAMNVAYGESEKRSVVRLNLMAFGSQSAQSL